MWFQFFDVDVMLIWVSYCFGELMFLVWIRQIVVDEIDVDDVVGQF